MQKLIASYWLHFMPNFGSCANWLFDAKVWERYGRDRIYKPLRKWSRILIDFVLGNFILSLSAQSTKYLSAENNPNFVSDWRAFFGPLLQTAEVRT